MMRLAFATITVATFAHCSSALPVELEPSWAPEPKGRGTLGILFSCVITLALCVWTAIHLNVIPEPTKGRIFAYKLGWVLMGMFTPEIVLWCSLAQRSEAKVVRDKLMEIRRRRWKLPVPSRASFWRRSWKNLKRCFRSGSGDDLGLDEVSMEVAFFVVMGGYVVRPNGFEGHPVTLTPRGFVILYDKGFIKDEELDPSRITDKTKADGFAKLVVCVQAFWLVIQGAGRLASRLPLPLLELHTIMHVLCAVPMYWFWWDKPMDVRFPIILDLEQPLAEEIYSSYKFPDDGRQLPPESLPEPPPTEDTTENIEHSQTNINFEDDSATGPGKARSHPARLHIYKIDKNRFRPRLRRQWKKQTEGWPIWKNIIFFPSDFIVLCFNWHKTFELWPPTREDLTDLEIKLLRLARSRKKGDTAAAFDHSPEDIGGGGDGDREPLCVRARMIHPKGNFRERIEDEDGDLPPDTYIYLVLLSILYGGAHCGAWNSHLPTPVERILWRCSAVIAGLYVPVFLVLVSIVAGLEISTEDLVFKRNEYIKNFVKHMIRLVSAIVNIIGTLYIAVGLLIFILARLYLIVESFLSLRSLRKGSFETVPWSNYWPHF